MCSGVEWLLKARKKLGITSKYLFARKNGAFPIDGCTAMRNVTEKCPDLSDPKSIRTRTIRTYTETTSQILNMTNDELKILADHMGHNINMHTDIYKLQTSLIEKTKVAKLLLASENGGVARFAGKYLDSISLEGGKRTWSKEEQDCLYKAFKSNIQNGKNVSSNEINNAMQKYKALAGRTENN